MGLSQRTPLALPWRRRVKEREKVQRGEVEVGKKELVTLHAKPLASC